MSPIKSLLHVVTAVSPSTKGRIFFLLGSLVSFTVILWLLVIFAAKQYPFLLGLALIAYGFGLRHAVDADHIAAIDNTTRKLMLDGQKPVAVGFFFSLGHSLIVILLSAFAAASTYYMQQNLPHWQEMGYLIGAIVSSSFLLMIGIINLIALLEIFQLWKKITKAKKEKKYTEEHFLSHKGFLTRFLHPVIKGIQASWQMLPLGILFGLGFDTATEVGLLSLSAVTATKDIPLWTIMLLPLAFTAGMTLIDTLDGILMLGAYGWASIHPLRKLYYNMIITFISVITALSIGAIQLVQFVSERTGNNTGVLSVIRGFDLSSLGYLLIFLFLTCWIVSFLFYKFHL